MHYFTISDLAHEFDVSTRTIRYYEERGLLSPIRTESGQRLYTKKERAKLKLILRGKQFGFSLDEIHEMISLFDEDRTGKKQLEKTVEYGRRKSKEVNERIEDLLQLKAEMEALNLSRVCNAVASVGIMKRALEEAKQYAERRTAFGHVLTNYPMVRETLANLTARQEVETSACFDMIALFDRVMAAPHEASEAEKAWLRLLIALLKMRTADEAIAFSHEAIELHGGNGYIEDFVTPRLLRDAQVLTVWEGTANILALEVLRLMRKYRIHERFIAEMKERLERLTAKVKPLARPAEEGLKELVAALARLGGQADEVQTFHAKAIANRMCDLYLSIIALERGQENDRNQRIAELFVRHVWERSLIDEQMVSWSNFDMIGQTILLVAVIADLATMILLAVFVSIYEPGHGSTWLLLGLFACGVVFYFVGKHFKKRSFVETMAKGTIQIGTRAVFTLMIVLVALSETFGAENILGAFLAGVLVSLLSPNKELRRQLDSFGYGFLIPIFFVMVGVDLNLRSLVAEPVVWVMIPLLFLVLVVSKVIPVSVLRVWYDMKTTLAASFLLVSTLSLVIAAAAIAKRIGMIDETMEGALILVAVLSSIVAPILFKKLFVRVKDERKKTVSFIGVNQFTLGAARELDVDQYNVRLFHIQRENIERAGTDVVFPVVEVPDYMKETLEKHDAFAVDIVVAWTGNEQVNAEVALAAKEKGVQRVLALAESSREIHRLDEAGVEVLSVLRSSISMLRASIESPRVAKMMVNKDTALHEVMMNTPAYHGVMLRQFPFMGDCIIVRIFRENESIVPHGDTALQMGDRLIVTGSNEYVEQLRHWLE